ncbi:MAG: FAD-binding protein [Rhodospirillaceae bacterium]|nr:FAD-binding protein [Rhodospirillaceae bacterium]
MSDFDVIVVGAGNAALAAANSAREQGAQRVLVLEKAPEKDRGGNTHYSGGLLRIAFNTGEDLRPLVPDAEDVDDGFLFEDVPSYTEDEFMADLMRVTAGKTDQTLAKILIGKSYETIRWMKDYGGIPMEPAISLSAIRVGNRVKAAPHARYAPFFRSHTLTAFTDGMEEFSPGCPRAWATG